MGGCVGVRYTVEWEDGDDDDTIKSIDEIALPASRWRCVGPVV